MNEIVVRTLTVIEAETVGTEAVSQSETEAANQHVEETASETVKEAANATVIEAEAAENVIGRRAMNETEDIIEKRKTDITLGGKKTSLKGELSDVL